MGTECSVIRSFRVKWIRTFKSLALVLSTEANIKVLFVLNCHSFPPTDFGISVGEKKGFVYLHPLSHIPLLSVSFQLSQTSLKNSSFIRGNVEGLRYMHLLVSPPEKLN